MASPFYLLDAALDRQRRVNEQERLALIDRALAWLDTHGQSYGINQAYLFGSVLRPGQFTEHSDLDLAVEQIEPTLLFSAISALSTAAEREVDIIELSKCHFAERIRQRGRAWMRMD